MIEYLSGLLNVDYFPEVFKLYQNYPNPFNPTTTISFDIKQSSDVMFLVYDLKGNMVHEYDFGYLNPGLYNYILNAQNFTSGIYIYTINTSYGFTDHKQMIVIK